jgi:predicted regulator of Ras-like GTPase activity (Roadblock/LC7/MglB family)
MVTGGIDNMNTRFSLPGELADTLETILENLRRRIEAECVMLADISGQLITAEGRLAEADPALVAALAASDVSALSELARQVGEEAPRGPFLHEGVERSFYLLNIADSFVLIVIFHAATPMGLVRIYAGRSGEELEDLAEQFEAYMEESQDQVLPSDFSSDLSDELEAAFGDF